MFVPDKDYIPSESSSCSGESRPSSPTVDDLSRAQTTEGLAADDDKQTDPLSVLKLAGYPVSTRSFPLLCFTVYFHCLSILPMSADQQMMTSRDVM